MEGVPLLECREVVAGYGGPVIGPVSLALSPGEMVGLHGANGSGKSTILGAITGAVKIFSGEIWRRSDLKVAHHRQRPVRPAELPLTGEELLRLTGASREDAPEPLTALLSLRLDRLSGGQFQLLHIWACLGSAAELVLLDEPTNNLDPEALMVLRQMLQRPRPERAVLVVSHEAGFLDDLCHRVVHLRCE
ncbi:MAG: ATP-binding cassette domain-containing protein [Desulfuromonadales bacterium]|nr:ATP-binding cassette domain-containing protein [Desulfuromonadales bacterium]